MDNEIFSLNENEYSLIMNIDNKSWFIEMIDYQKVLFIIFVIHL